VGDHDYVGTRAGSVLWVFIQAAGRGQPSFREEVTRMHRAWPFVGRDAELTRVGDALAAGRGVVITGEAGVGKSRLLAEAVQQSGAASDQVLTVRATRSSTVLPLGAFAPLLPVDEPAPSLATARRAILARAGPEPGAPSRLVLAIDDAHALDPASAALTHQLVTEDGVRVVATVRSGESVPDAIVGLWKDGQCERLDLSPLGRAELDRLVVDALGGPVDGRLQHELWTRTVGNALFARELLAAARDHGGIEERGGIWTLTGPFTAPPRLRELVADRLRDLQPDERVALDLLALGEPLPFDVLLELTGSAALEQLEDRGLLVIDDDAGAGARLNHPLLADVLLDSLGRAKRRRLLRSLVEAVSARTLPVDVGDRVVRWRIDAGLEVSPADLLAAARRYTLVDPALAESLARRLQASDPDSATVATLMLVEILTTSGRPDEAAALLQALPSGSDHERHRREVEIAMVVAFGLNRSRDAAERLEGLLEDVADEDWGYVAGQIPLLWLLAGEIHRARAAAEDLLADPRATEADRLRAEMVAIPGHNLVGQPLTAAARAAAVLPRLVGNPMFIQYMVGQVRTAVATAYRYAGALDRAEAEARRAHEEATEQGIGLLRGVAALRLGQVLLWRGSMARAEQLFLEAAGALDGDPMTRASAVDHVRYTRALTGRSDMPGALAPNALYAVEHGFLSSVIEAAGGNLSYARALALNAARRAVPSGHISYAVFALYEAARHGAAADAAELAAELPPLEGSLLPALVAAVGALAARDADRLEEAGVRLEAVGCLLHAAELLATAAARASEQGLSSRASLLRTRVRQLADRCDGATTDLLRRPGDDGLTTREREVAGFAARGLSDVEIAARLAVSRRTVETHLYRVYGKLGVSGRRDLAPLFTR
jgi:DNA-binding CsgD family transcriptional regulator